MRALEPSFGAGDFLFPLVERLLQAWKAHGRSDAVSELRDSIRAVELHRATFEATKADLVGFLTTKGISNSAAAQLADAWLIHGDFLLTPLDGTFDFVVGNPPYVRQELIPDQLLNEYRARYRTIYDRADLYVPFIERSLSLLSPKGQLGFICADRWMKNRYGRPLRAFISERFYLKIYVDMTSTDAFHSDVAAYPAITIFARGQGATRVAYRPQVTRQDLNDLARQLLEPAVTGSTVAQIEKVSSGPEPWILETDERLALVRRLESRFPVLEEAGCKVGIGVATGADQAFIAPMNELDVEDDRKLPLVTTRDILTGRVAWRGLGVVNPFDDEGRLVSLERYPRLRRYLEARREQIARRHVARKEPANWYRTIDRIHAHLAPKPKLLIPDIKGDAHIVLEAGGLYPHHNLYYIISEEWDLEVLQGVLMSGIARLFVGARVFAISGSVPASHPRAVLVHGKGSPSSGDETCCKSEGCDPLQ